MDLSILYYEAQHILEGKEIETSNCSIQDLSPHQLTGIFDYHLWHV